jgi:hypothetical protein
MSVKEMIATNIIAVVSRRLHSTGKAVKNSMTWFEQEFKRFKRTQHISGATKCTEF